MAVDYKAGDSTLGYKFIFKLDGIEMPAVTEVTGLKLEVEKIELKSQTSDGKYIISHMPGPVKAGEITVTRYLTDDQKLVDWWNNIMKGTLDRHTATVEIRDLAGDKKVRGYSFNGVWVKSIETNSFKAGSNDAMTEKVVLTYTGGEVK